MANHIPVERVRVKDGRLPNGGYPFRGLVPRAEGENTKHGLGKGRMPDELPDRERKLLLAEAFGYAPPESWRFRLAVTLPDDNAKPGELAEAAYSVCVKRVMNFSGYAHHALMEYVSEAIIWALSCPKCRDWWLYFDPPDEDWLPPECSDRLHEGKPNLMAALMADYPAAHVKKCVRNQIESYERACSLRGKNVDVDEQWRWFKDVSVLSPQAEPGDRESALDSAINPGGEVVDSVDAGYVQNMHTGIDYRDRIGDPGLEYERLEKEVIESAKSDWLEWEIRSRLNKHATNGNRKGDVTGYYAFKLYYLDGDTWEEAGKKLGLTSQAAGKAGRAMRDGLAEELAHLREFARPDDRSHPARWRIKTEAERLGRYDRVPPGRRKRKLIGRSHGPNLHDPHVRKMLAIDRRLRLSLPDDTVHGYKLHTHMGLTARVHNSRRYGFGLRKFPQTREPWQLNGRLVDWQSAAPKVPSEGLCWDNQWCDYTIRIVNGKRRHVPQFNVHPEGNYAVRYGKPPTSKVWVNGPWGRFYIFHQSYDVGLLQKIAKSEDDCRLFKDMGPAPA